MQKLLSRNEQLEKKYQKYQSLKKSLKNMSLFQCGCGRQLQLENLTLHACVEFEPLVLQEEVPDTIEIL